MAETARNQTVSAGKRALEGVRIVDLTDELAIYCTRILADLGAEVIRVNLPSESNDNARVTKAARRNAETFAAFMNVNKSEMSIDPADPADRRHLDALIDSCTLVVETLGGHRCAELGLDPDEIRQRNPALVWTRITPFGDDGPRSQWRADDLIAQAMGGLMRLSGAPDREPLRLFGNQTCYIAGLHAATASLLALLEAEASGEGQLVDVSVQECIAHTLENAIQFYDGEKKVREREGAGPEAGVGLFQCADGLIYLYASAWMMRASWQGMVVWMIEREIEGAQDYTQLSWLDMDFRRTPAAREQLRASIEALLKGYSKKQFYEEAQRRKVLSAPLNTVPDLLQNPQLSYYDWYRRLAMCDGQTGILTGPPVRLSETPATIRHEATVSGRQWT